MKDKINKFTDLLMDLFLREEVPDPVPDGQMVRQETEKIREELFRQFYSMEDRGRQQVFIRNLHALLVNLSDHFFETLERDAKQQPGTDREEFPVQQAVLLALDDLLAFIWEHFSPCCSKEQKIPERSRPAFTREILAKLEPLILPATDPEQVLLETVKDTIRQRLSGENDGITYGLRTYLCTFTEDMNKMRSSTREHVLPVTLTDVLVAYNFNSVPLMYDLVSGIREEVDQIESAKDKIKHLHYWLKRISQVTICPDCAFDVRNEPVNGFLGKWIRAEILFHEKNLQLLSGPFYPLNFPGMAPDGIKLEVDLSVAQMACLLRLVTECGLVKGNSVRELFNFLAEHFRSKKQENISAESIRVKYYQIEESTRKEAHKILLRLLEKVSRPM